MDVGEAEHQGALLVQVIRLPLVAQLVLYSLHDAQGVVCLAAEVSVDELRGRAGKGRDAVRLVVPATRIY